MEAVTDLQVSLVPYTEYDTLTLGSRLRELAVSAEERLRIDFPQVLRRYGSVESARAAVHTVKQGMYRGEGGVRAYVVEHGATIVGVATYQQRSLWRWPGWGPFRYPERLVRGPLLAVWLGQRQSNTRLLPAILKAGAKEVTRDRRLRGNPWTLVRPSHAYVQAALADNGNGFGGFRAYGLKADYSGVDGVTLPRVPYVAYCSVAQLREWSGA